LTFARPKVCFVNSYGITIHNPAYVNHQRFNHPTSLHQKHYTPIIHQIPLCYQTHEINPIANPPPQRAFRQRKEGYIKKLEEQVRELHTLEDNYKVIQSENYSLRDYILQLQRRLLESQGEYPQPPAAVSVLLNNPHQHHEAHRRGPDPTPPATHAPTAVMGQTPDQQSSSLQSQMAPLQAQLQASAAQAVADLRESAAKQRQVQEEYLARGTYKGEGEGAAEEELSRQLQGSADIPGGMGGL
jgi:hypothetical protein